MNAPDIAQAMVTDQGMMAIVVLAGLMVAVGLAVFVLDTVDCIKKKERDDGSV